ncbi:uncharacterized protein LOC135500891 isoform X1 [Lineus longissimus]|uniref:uncharacterized protein LOC135500891 isoform X1 n=1 Tax=Lineus longissimus TaxID=88925 RepID=UPI00315C8208
MDDEERKKKLQAGKERLAQFQKRKARKKRRKSDTPTAEDGCNRVDSTTLSGTDSADQSVSSDVLSFSYEESDQGSVGISDLSGDDTSNVDISFEAKVELKHAADEITQLEEQLFGKQAAIDDLSQENEKLRGQLSSQSLNGSSTPSGDSALVPDVEEDLQRKVKEYELALAQRDDVLKQLSDSLQTEKQGRNSVEEAYSVQTEQLTQQIHQLQGQMQQAGETLQEQTAKQGQTAKTLLGAKTQIVSLQEALHEKDATLKLLTSKFTDKIEELMNTQEENERLKKSEAEAKDEVEVLKKSEAQAKATASKLQNERQAFEESTEELVNMQIEFELLKKSEAEVRAAAETLQSEVQSLKYSNLELMNAREQLQKSAAEAYATAEKLQAELETLQRSNQDLLNAHEQVKQSETLARASVETLQSELKCLERTHEMLTLSSNEQIAQIDQLRAELDSVSRKEIVIPIGVDKTLEKGESLIGNVRSEKVLSDMKFDSGSIDVDEEKVVPIWIQSEESAVEQDILFSGAEGMSSAPQYVISASQEVTSATQGVTSALQGVVSASHLKLSSTSSGPDLFNLENLMNSVETKSLSPLVHEEEVIPVEIQSEEASVDQRALLGVDATTPVVAMQDDVSLNIKLDVSSPSVLEEAIIPLEMQQEESSADKDILFGGEEITPPSSEHGVMSSNKESCPSLDHDDQGDIIPVAVQYNEVSPNQSVQLGVNSNLPVKTLSDYFSPVPKNLVTAPDTVPVEMSGDQSSHQVEAGKEPEIDLDTYSPSSNHAAEENLGVLDEIDSPPKDALQPSLVHALENAEIAYQDEIRTLKEQLDISRNEKETEIKRLETECKSLRAKFGVTAEKFQQATGPDKQIGQTSAEEISPRVTGATDKAAVVGESKAELVQKIAALEEECQSLKNQLDSAAEGSGLLSDQSRIGASDEAAEIMEANAELMKINEMVENRCLQFEDDIVALQEECKELKNLNSVLESKQKEFETQCRDLGVKYEKAAKSVSDSDFIFSDFEERLGVLGERCKQLENEKSDMEDSYNDSNEKCNTLETQRLHLEGALSEMECRSRESQNQCLELQEKCLKLESDRNDLDKLLKDSCSTKELTDENVHQLKARLNEAENRLKDFKTKHLDLENRNKECETECKKLSDCWKDSDTMRRELQTQLDEREGKIQDLKVRGLALEKQNHELEHTCSDLKDELSQLSSKVSEEQEKVRKLAYDLGISEERCNAVISEKDRESELLRADLAQNNAMVIEKEIEVVKLAHDLQVARENMNGIVSEKDRQLESLKVEISQLSDKISERDHLVEKTAQDLEAAESKHLEVLKARDIEVGTLKGDIASMSLDLSQKVQQTEQLNGHLNDKESRCNVLQAELEQLQRQLESLSQEHEWEVSEKNQEIEHLREEVGKRWDASREKQSAIEKREVQVKSLTDEIAHYKGQLERLFQGQQAEMENQKEFDKLLEELGTLKQQVHDKECQISEDAEVILRLEKDVENERMKFEQKVKEVKQLEMLATKTEAEIERFSKEAVVMEQALLERERIMTESRQKVDSLSNTVTAVEAQLQDREQKISEDAIAIENFGRSAEMETVEIEILQAKELNSHKEVERLANEVQTLQQLVMEKEKKISEATAVIEKLGKDVDSERKQILQKSNEVQKLWDEVRAAQFAIQNKDLAIGGHLQTIDILLKEKEQMSQVLNQEHYQKKQLSEAVAQEQNKNQHLSNLLGQEQSQTQGHLLEIRSLQDHLDQSLEEITRAQQEIQHYRLQIERLLMENDTDKLLSTEVEKLSVDVQDYKEKLGELRTGKDAVLQELEIVKVERDNFKQKLDQVLAEKEGLSNELGSDVRSLKKEVDHYQHDSSDLLEQMSRLNEGHAHEITMLNEQILGRNDDIGKMRTALEGWSKAYHAMQYNAEQLTIALQQRDSHINQQGNLILEQSADIQAKASQVETSGQQVQNLEEEKDGLDRQIKDMSTKNVYLSNEVEKLQTNIENLYVQLDRFGKEASSPRFQIQANMYDERIQDLIDQVVHKNLCVDAAELEKSKLTDELKAERLKVAANQEMVSALLKSTAEQKAQIKQLQAQVQELKAEKEEVNCSRLRSESIEAALRAELEKPHVEVEEVSDDSLISNLQAEVSNLKLDKQTANATLQALEVERNHLRTEVQRLGAALEKRKSEEELDVVERIHAQQSATLLDGCSASSVELIVENIIVPCEVAPAQSGRSFIPSEDIDPKQSITCTGDITDGANEEVIPPAKLAHIGAAAHELVAIMVDETIPDTDAIPNVPFNEHVSEDDIIPSEVPLVASAIEDSLAVLNQLSYSESDAIVMTPSRSDPELIVEEAVSSPLINPEDIEHSTPRPRVPDHLSDYPNYRMLIENLSSEVEKQKKEKDNLESILVKERSVRVAEMVTSNAKIQLLVNDNEAYQVNMAMLRDVSRTAQREKYELERRIKGLEFEKKNAVALLKDQGLEEEMEYRVLAESIGSELQRLREEKEHILGSTQATSASDQVDSAAEGFGQEAGSDTHESTISKLKQMLREMKKEHSDLKSQLTGLEYDKWNSESILTADIRKEKAEKDRFRMLAKSLSSELEKRKHERSDLSELSLQEHAGAIVMEAVNRAQVTVLGDDLSIHRANLCQLKSVVDQCKSDNAALESKIIVLESALENAESKEKVLQDLNQTLRTECDHLKLHLDQLSEKSQDYVADLVTKQTISYAELQLANTDLDAYKLNLAKLKDLLSQSEAQRSQLQRVVNEEIRKQDGMTIEHRTRMSLIASESQAELAKLRMVLENLSSEHEQLKQKYQNTESSAQRMVAELIAEAVVAVSQLQLELADVDAYKLNLAKLKQLLSDAEKERKVMENSITEQMHKYEGRESESQNQIEGIRSECEQVKEELEQQKEKSIEYQTDMLLVAAESGGEVAKLRMLLENLSSEHEKLKQQAEHTESSAQKMVAELIAEAVVAVSKLQLELADVDAYKLNLAKLKQLLSDSEGEKKVLETSLEDQMQKYESLETESQNQIERLCSECGYLTEQVDRQNAKAVEQQTCMALNVAESGREVEKLRMLLENLSSAHEELKQQAEHTESSAQKMVAELIAEAVVAVSKLQLELADVDAYKLNLAKLKQLLSDSEGEKKVLETSLEDQMQKYESLETESQNQIERLCSECGYLTEQVDRQNEKAVEQQTCMALNVAESGREVEKLRMLLENLSSEHEKLKQQAEHTESSAQKIVAELIAEAVVAVSQLQLELADVDAYKLNLAKLKQLLSKAERERKTMEITLEEQMQKFEGTAVENLKTTDQGDSPQQSNESLQEGLATSKESKKTSTENQSVQVETDDVLTKLKDSQAKVALLMEENFVLQEDINNLHQEEKEKLEGLQSEIASLQDMYAKLQSDSNGKDTKITELEAKLRDFAEQISELFKQVDGYVADADILNAQVSNIKSEKEAAEKAYKDEINKQRQELNLQKEKMQEILAKHDDVIEFFEQEKKKLKIQLGKAAKEKERRKVELSEACAARDEYATTFDTLGQQVSRFQGEVERLEVENESLKNQLKKSKEASADAIEDFELKNQLLESNCNEYLLSSNDLQQEAVTQRLALEKQDELVEELTEQLNGLSGENARLQEDVKNLGEDLSAKERDFVTLREELAAQKRELEIREVRNEELMSQLTAGKIDRARSTNDLQGMRDNLSDKEECLTNLLEENEAIKTQLRTYQDQETETDVQASADELEKKLDESTKELVKLAEEKEELALEVATITVSKDEYVTSLNTLTEQTHGFRNEVERLEIDNRNLRSVLANSKEDNVQKIEDLINKNSELSAQVSSLEGTIEKLEQNCNEYLQSCNDLQEENINQKLENEKERELSNEMRGLLDNLHDVQSLNQTLATDLQRVKEDLSAKEDDLVCQQEHVKELTQQLQELTGVKAENQTLAADLQQLKEDLTVKERDLVSLHDQFDKLAGSMQAKAELSEEVLGVQHQLNESQHETRAVQAELKAVQERLAEFEADKEALLRYVDDYDDRIAESQHFKEEKEKLTSQVNDLLEICDKYKQEDDDHAADKQNKGHEVERLEADIASLKADVLTLEEEKKRFEEKCTDLERWHQVEQVKKLGASDLQEAYEDLVNKLVAVEKENKELEEIAHNLKDLCAGFKDENLGLRQSLEESGASISRLEATVRDFEKEFDHAHKEFVVEMEKMKEKMKVEVESMQKGYDQALENVRRTMDADKEALLKIHENEIETLGKDHAEELEKMRKEVEENKKGRKSYEASVKDLQDQKSKIIEDLITSREELNTLKSAYEKDLCNAAEKYEQAQLENRAQQDNYADLATVIESMREKHEEDCKALKKDLEGKAESEKSHLRDQLRKYEIEVSNLHSGLGSELLPDDMYILRTEHERFVADQKANYDAIVFGYDAALTNVNENHAEELARLKMENDQLRAALKLAWAEGSIRADDKSKQAVPPYVLFEPEQEIAMETIEEQMLTGGLLENICPESVELKISPEVVGSVFTVPDSVSMGGLASANAEAEGFISSELIEPEMSEDVASEVQFFVAASNEGPLLDGGEAPASISDQLPEVAERSVSTDSEQVSVVASLEGQDRFNPEALESLMSELVALELEKNCPKSPESSLEEQVMAEQVYAVSSASPYHALLDESTADNREEQGTDALEGQSAFAAGGISEQNIGSTTVPYQGPVTQGSLVEADKESSGTETTDGEHSVDVLSMDALPLQEKLSELKKKLEESDRCITELEEKLKAKDGETATKIEELEKLATALGVDLREMQAECEQLIEERDTVKVKCEQNVKNLQNEHDTEIQRLKDLVYEHDVKEKQLEASNAKHMEELEGLRFELMQENEEIEAMKGNSLEELLNQERQLRDQYQEELEEVRLELNIQSEEQKQVVEELNEEIVFLKAENEKLQMDISVRREKIRELECMLGNAAADETGDFIPWEGDMQAGEELARIPSPNAEFEGKSILQGVFEMEGVPDSPASPFPGDEIWCQKSLQDEPEEIHLMVEDVPPADDLKNQIKGLEAKHEFEMKQLTEHLKDMAAIEKQRLRAEIELELRDEKRQYKTNLDLELKTQLKAIRQEQEMKFIEELQKSRSEMMRKHDDKIEAIRKKFTEQTLHQESVESTDELEEVVQRLQVENQDLLETRHILLEQLDNAHFLKEAQQEQILSLNAEKENLEEKVLKLQAQLAKFTGESSFEQAAELDKDEWRIKYDRLLTDHEPLKTNVWGQPDSVGAELRIPKSTELQELWHPQSPRPADFPIQGESEGEGIVKAIPEQAGVPVWGQSEDSEVLGPKSPAFPKTRELPMTEETSTTVPKIPKPVESLNMSSPMPQNMEGNFCFEEDLNTVNETSFVVNDNEGLEGGFERLEETIHDPAFGQQEELGCTPMEDTGKVEKDYAGRRVSSSSSTKLQGEYVSAKPLDSTESPVDNEGQYISEITQTENDAVIDGQEQGEFLSESPTDVIKMRDNMYKYARENETLRSEIEALLTNRDAPVVVELRSEIQNLEEENEALRIHCEILQQKYADLCEELKDLKGHVNQTDVDAADGGFAIEDAGYAGFVPDSLASVDDDVGFVPDAGSGLVCPDETDFGNKSEPDKVKSFTESAVETEFVPGEEILHLMDYKILKQKYAEVCDELMHLKEQMAQLEPEAELKAENACVVSDAGDELVNQSEENQELVPKLNPETVAAEKDKSVDTGYGSFTPDAEVVIADQGVQGLKADLSQFVPEQKLSKNLRGDILQSVQEQLPLAQVTDATNGVSEDEIRSKDLEDKLCKLQNDFEKFTIDSTQAYDELLNSKVELDEVVTRQNKGILELEGLREKCGKLAEANTELSDEIIEKEKDFCEKVAAFEKEMNDLKIKLKELEDTNDEMKMNVEDLEEQNDELKKHSRTLADELGKVCDQNITLQRELDGWASLQEPANPDHIFWPIAGEALAIDEMELGPSHESSGFEGSSMDAPESAMKPISEEVEMSVPGEQIIQEEEEDEILPVAPEKDISQDELCHEEQILPEAIPVEEAIAPEIIQSQQAAAPAPGRAEELLLTLTPQEEIEAKLSLPDGPEEKQGAPVLMSTPQKNDRIDRGLQDSLEVSESFNTTGQSSQMEDTFATAMTTPRSIDSFTGRQSVGGHSDSTGELLGANCFPDFGKSLTDNELNASLQKLSDECEAYRTKQKGLEEHVSRSSTPVQELLQEPQTEGTRLFQEEIATLKDEKVELKSLNDGLRDVTDQLRRKIAQLLKKNDDMEIKNMNLEVECEALRTRVNEMEIELDRYFKNNDKLTKKNKDLSLKCNRLETLLADRLSEMKKPKVRDAVTTRRGMFLTSKSPSNVIDDVALLEKEQLNETHSPSRGHSRKKEQHDEPSSSTQKQGPKRKPRAGVSQEDRLEEPIPSSTKHHDGFEKPIAQKLPVDEGDKLQLTQRWVSEHSLNSPTDEQEITIPLGAGQETAVSRLDVAQDKYQKDMTRLEDDLKQLEDRLSSSDLDKRSTPNDEQNTTAGPSRFYDELRELRRVMQETKEVYDHENSQLKAALDHERFSHLSDMTQSGVGGHTPQQMLSPRSNLSRHDTRPYYNHPVDYLALHEKVAMLQNSNQDLIGQLDDQSRRLHEQEKIVQDLKNHLDTSDIVTSEVQQVFTHQLAMLQTQRDFLEKKIKEQRGKDTELADVLGDKLILEETLRREKELLRHIIHEKEVQEVELMRSKLVVEEKERGHRRLQYLLKEKDKLEADLLQQKQTLQDELNSIEGSLISRSGRNRQERDQALNDWQAPKGPHYRTSTPSKAPVSLDSTIQSQSALGGVVHSAAGDFDYQHSVLSVDSTRSDQEHVRRLRRLRMESELCSERAVERLKSRYDAVRLNKEHSTNVLQWRNLRRPHNTYSSF